MDNYNVGQLIFANKEGKSNFDSLNKDELNEFTKDLAFLLKNTFKQMLKENFFEGKHIANQRIGNKNFEVAISVDLNPTKEPLIIFEKFNQVSLDQYLDNINSSKTLTEKGYIKLK